MIEFQAKLLDGIPFEDIENHDVDIEEYTCDLELLFKLNMNEIGKIPFYLRILLVMTIRDASIIISFATELTKSFLKSISIDSTIIYYNINIIDLDIKPLSNFERYLEEIKLHG